MADFWEPAEQVQKNSKGEYRALIGGEWVKVAAAQKNAAGQYRVDRGVVSKEIVNPAEFHKRSAESATRGEYPLVSTLADLNTGMSGSFRGIANHAERLYNAVTGKSNDTPTSLITGKKPEPLGERIWPKAPGSAGTTAKLYGSMLDPVPYVVGGAIGKVAPYVPVSGQGFIKGAQAVGANTLSGATAGGIIGGLSDEGTAAKGALIGGVLSGGLPAVGALTKWGYNTAKSAIAPATEAGRTAFGQKYFAEVLGPARGKVAAALASPNEIIPGSPTTAADRIAAANVGQTDKFGSALVKAQDVLATQPENGIADVAKSIAAQQEAARAGEIGKIAQTPQALAQAIGARKATTDPMRGLALRNANETGRQVPALEAEVASREASRISALQDKGRFQTTAAQQQSRGENWHPIGTGYPRGPSRYAPHMDVASEARVATAEMDPIIATRAAERDLAQWQLDAYKAAGLKPIDGSALAARIESKLQDPTIGVSDVNRRVISRVAKKIRDWTANGEGQLDARALYEIRKTTINEEIERLMPNAGASAQKKRAAGLLTQLKPMIDDEITAAGGTGWKQYLTKYSDMAADIDRMKVGQGLQEALTGATGAERGTVMLNTVRKLEDELGAKLTPQQMESVNKVTAELTRNVERDSLASGVNPKNLFDMAERGKGSFHIPNLLSRPAMVTNWLMGRLGNSADDIIAQDVGMMLQKDPAGFAAKYLQDVPVTQRAVVMAAIQQKLRTAAPYTNAAAVSATQNGE